MCKYPLLFLSFLWLIACNPSTTTENSTPKVKTEKLGEISFDVKGDSPAEPDFLKGLLLLHSFEYEDARTAFLAAQEKDPMFALAYWGEAMTYNHSLWHRQEQAKAMAALDKLAPTAEEREKLATSELQKDLLQSVEILFSGAETKYERDIAYNEFLGKLTEKYPDNHEISAFYAVSLLAASRNGRDEMLYEKSARVAQGIIEENPSHPGALHYLIHSYDDPVHAHLAKKAADSYSKVAPDAAHALHMPSHIYVALGRWDDVVTSNIASWNASVKRMERLELGDEARSFHALNWLQYGFLQRGEVERAEKIMNDMVGYVAKADTKRAKSYLLMMKGAQMVETDTWEGKWADLEVDVSGMNIMARSEANFLEGRKAYHQKDVTAMENIIAEMEAQRKKAQNMVGDAGFAMCSAAGYATKPPNQLDIDMSTVMEMELRAYLADLKDDKKMAQEWFAKGAALDESLHYSFGPPAILKPVHEAYGEWLLENKKYTEALTIFEAALEREPRRLRSLEGKKKAAAMLKNKEIVAAVDKELAVSLETKEREAIL